MRSYRHRAIVAPCTYACTLFCTMITACFAHSLVHLCFLCRLDMPLAVQSMKLPKNWVAVLDEESGEYFYWNQQTDATQWEIPTSEGGAAGGAGKAEEPAVAPEEDDKAGAEYVAAGKRKNRQVIMAESYDPTAGGKMEIKRVEKPEAAKAVIRAALAGGAAFLFSGLSPDELETVVMAMTEKVVAAGDVVIRQGDKGDYFYVAESGTYSIFVNGNRVAGRGPGDSFGELALLYNCPRAATIQADGPGRLWALDRQAFRFLVASTRDGQLAEIVRGLRCVAAWLACPCLCFTTSPVLSAWRASFASRYCSPCCLAFPTPSHCPPSPVCSTHICSTHLQQRGAAARADGGAAEPRG